MITGRSCNGVLRRLVVIASSIVVLGLGGCGDSSNTTTGSADATSTGAKAGPPSEVRIDVPKRYEPAKAVIARTGCLACHQIGDSGNRNLASNLTHIGSRMPKSGILRALNEGPGIMPSFRSLGKKKLNEVADFFSHAK